MTLIRRQRFRSFGATLAAALWFAQVGLCEELKKTTAPETRGYPGAQNSISTPESAIGAMVKNLAEPLKAVKARRVVVLDLRGPDGHLHPVGKWFADQVSVAIRKEFPKVKTIDRAQLSSNDEIAGTPMDTEAIFQREVHQARLTGADVAITGDFAAVSDQIGVSLNVIKLADLEKTHEVRTGLIPISKELTDLTSEAIPTLELVDGIPRAGKSGIGMPVCTYAPTRNSSRSGLVVLEIVVTKDGRPERIKVIKSLDPELAALAIQSVQSWRCKPALGFDGNPIAVVTPIQITFR
jgi:TonB family protein